MTFLNNLLSYFRKSKPAEVIQESEVVLKEQQEKLVGLEHTLNDMNQKIDDITSELSLDMILQISNLRTHYDNIIQEKDNIICQLESKNKELTAIALKLEDILEELGIVFN
jgi:hypothetical protein